MGIHELILLHAKLNLHKHYIGDLYPHRHRASPTTKQHQGEAPMRQLTIAAATVAIAAMISAAPAAADHLGGGPVKQNGKCWKSPILASDGRYGSWEACPSPASAPAATTAKRRHHA
jgi:hypothetical protein